jgi:sulfur carrier protein
MINGKERNFDTGMTICELLKKLDLNEEKEVVEVNFTMISREKYKEPILNKENKVEIVSFVGGS